jgi:hypothetical protein
LHFFEEAKLSQAQSKPQYRLKIIAGLHKDAELYLQEDVRYTIGSGDECDIVLLDSGVEMQHLSFSISLGKIHLLEMTADIFIDGRQLTETPFFLSEFQVTSLGDAHLVIGPSGAPWPIIEPPVIRDDASCVTSFDLVVVEPNTNLPQRVRTESRFQKILRVFLERVTRANKKIVLAVCSFLAALMIFIGDTWLAPALLDTVANSATTGNQIERLHPAGPLLTLFDGIQSVHNNTMVSAGLVEPTVPTETLGKSDNGSAEDHIRQVLKRTWGQRLHEATVDAHNIQFKGFDERNHQDLRMDLKQDNQGELTIKAITQSAKKKKAILSQLGDIIRVKVDVAEDMENVCQRVLEKKGVRKALARYDLQENLFTIQGQSDNKDTIASVYDIVAKAFPDIRVKNDVKMNVPRPSKISIRAVSTSGLPYVILRDGSKVFSGGQLSNGCTIAEIAEDHILLDCNGAKRKQKL